MTKFQLSYGSLIIGYLLYEADQDVWQFSYSEEFKNQNVYTNILQFPDCYKTYKSRQLWAFFYLRVMDRLPKILPTGDYFVEQLRKVGRRVIQNPYILEEVI